MCTQVQFLNLVVVPAADTGKEPVLGIALNESSSSASIVTLRYHVCLEFSLCGAKQRDVSL